MISGSFVWTCIVTAFPTLRHHPKTVTRGSCRGTAKLILVLEATRNGPQHSSRRPTMPRPRPTKGTRRRRATAHHFQPGRALPDRGNRGLCLGQPVGGAGSWRTRPRLAVSSSALELPPAASVAHEVSTIVTTDPLTALAYSASCRAPGAPA